MGKTGVGKSTVAKTLASKTDFELYEIGHEVKKVFLEKVKVESDSLLEEKNPNKLAQNSQSRLRKNKDYLTTTQRLTYTNEIIKKYGNDYYVRRILEKRKNENIIIIGVRSLEEINAIKRKIRFPFFVGLTCDEEERKKRFIEREHEFMPVDKAIRIFEERSMREEEWGVERVLEESNLNIHTNYKNPSELATDIMEKYEEFVRQQLFLEERIRKDNEFSR